MEVLDSLLFWFTCNMPVVEFSRFHYAGSVATFFFSHHSLAPSALVIFSMPGSREFPTLEKGRKTGQKKEA